MPAEEVRKEGQERKVDDDDARDDDDVHFNVDVDVDDDEDEGGPEVHAADLHLAHSAKAAGVRDLRKEAQEVDELLKNIAFGALMFNLATNVQSTFRQPQSRPSIS